MKKIILLLVFIFSYSLAYTAEYDIFPISTEMQISKIRNLVERASEEGVYVSVGGERAFRGASMYSTIDHLIIFDLSPEIIKFSQINTKLLYAENKELYKNLRWYSDFVEWQRINKDLTEEDFEWWSDNIRNIKGYDIPERLNRTGGWKGYTEIKEKLMRIYPKLATKYNNRISSFLRNVTWEDIEVTQKNFSDPLSKLDFENFDQDRKNRSSCGQKFIDNQEVAVDWGDIIDYRSGNYLFDNKLYERLHKLAISNKIAAIQLDLSSVIGQRILIDEIKKTQNKIAILDLDNLYLYDYMGEVNFRKALYALLPYGSSDSILVLMSNYKDYACAQFSIYVGFTFENIKSWPKQPFFDKFINSLPIDIQPLIDGRLYESDDKIPLYLINSEK